MKEFLLCVFLVGTVIVRTAAEALSVEGRGTRWFGTQSQDSLMDFKIATLPMGDTGVIHRIKKYSFFSIVPYVPHRAVFRKGRQKKRENMLLDHGTFGHLVRKRFLANIRNGRRVEANIRSFGKQGGDDEFVRNFRHIFRQMLKNRGVLSSGERKEIKKRELGIDSEPYFGAMNLVDSREIPLGNRDSLVYEGHIAPRKPNGILIHNVSLEDFNNKNINTTSHDPISTVETTKETFGSKIEVTMKSKEEKETSLLPVASTDPTTEEAIAEENTAERMLVTLGEKAGNWSSALAQGTVAVKPQSLVLIPLPDKGAQRSPRSTDSAGDGGGGGGADGTTGDEVPPGGRAEWNPDEMYAKVHSSRTRVAVALCGLGVALVALLASTPTARRVAVWAKCGLNSARGGGDGHNEGELLVPRSSPEETSKEEYAELSPVEKTFPNYYSGADVGDGASDGAGDGVGDGASDGAGDGAGEGESRGVRDDHAFTRVVHPRMMLSRLRTALMAAVRRLQVNGHVRLREMGFTAGEAPLSPATSGSSICV